MFPVLSTWNSFLSLMWLFIFLAGTAATSHCWTKSSPNFLMHVLHFITLKHPETLFRCSRYPDQPATAQQPKPASRPLFWFYIDFLPICTVSCTHTPESSQRRLLNIGCWIQCFLYLNDLFRWKIILFLWKNFCSTIKYQQIRSCIKRFLFVTEKNNNKNGSVQICVIGNSGNVLTWWVVTMPHCLIASRQTLANTRHNKQSFISLTRAQLYHLLLLPGFFCGLACFRRPGCEVVALTQVWAAWDGPWAGPTEGWVSGLGEGLVIMSLLRLSMMTTHVGTLVH